MDCSGGAVLLSNVAPVEPLARCVESLGSMRELMKLVVARKVRYRVLGWTAVEAGAHAALETPSSRCVERSMSEVGWQSVESSMSMELVFGERSGDTRATS